MSYKVTIDLEFKSKPNTNQIVDYVKELGNDLDYKLQDNSKEKTDDEKLANSFGLELSDFSDDGSDLNQLRDIVEGNE